MEYLKQSIEVVREGNLLKKVELCGRVCYKSEDKITETSALKFITNIARLGHGSVMEHGGVYLKVDNTMNNYYEKQLLKIGKSKYSKMIYKDGFKYIYTNLRVIYENSNDFYDIIVHDRGLPPGVDFFVPAENDPYRRVTVKIVTDRRIETELVRHRVASFSIESTRYVNYFKKGMAFIDIRKWCTSRMQKFWWKCATKSCEFFYNRMIGAGAKPEIARSVLLSSNKAEIMMTASIKDWEHFFELRTVKAAHPQIREIADDIKFTFKFRNYI